MPSVENNKAAIAAQVQSTALAKSKLRTGVERFLISIAMIGTIVVFFLYSDLISQYTNFSTPKSTIYGKWVEQNVAPYAREEFILSERGVTVNGATVATDFKFDGDSFSYKIGSSIRRFEFVDETHTEMKLDDNTHYLPVFHLEGRAGMKVR